MKISDQMNLRGHKALVTGSGSGIGHAIALALAEHGCDLIIHDEWDDTQCKHIAAEIEDLYRVSCDFVIGDISKTKAVDAILKDVSISHEPDILVLNASVQIRRAFLEITEDDFTTQCNANLWSVIRFIQFFYPAMEKNRWGRILTLGSVQQQKPHRDMAVYAACKSAVMNLVTNLAVPFAPSGVTINNLSPGVINTNRNEEVLSDAIRAEAIRSRIPAGFFGNSADCAPIALLLCSDAARYITGQNIYCDGGMGL